MIRAAAILWNDGRIFADRDHASCIQKGGEVLAGAGTIQGFVTTDGEFVTRVEAHRIAYSAGQCIRAPGGAVFTSEEIWSRTSDGPCFWDEEQETYIHLEDA